MSNSTDPKENSPLATRERKNDQEEDVAGTRGNNDRQTCREQVVLPGSSKKGTKSYVGPVGGHYTWWEKFIGESEETVCFS